MLTRVPIPTNMKPEDFNNGGLSDYTPYYFSCERNLVLIDEDWWVSDTNDQIKQTIFTRLNEIGLTYV